MGLRDRMGRGRRDKFSDFVSFKDVEWPAPTYAGIDVTEDSAVMLPSVYRCWSLNAETISSLPVDIMAKRGAERVPYQEPMWVRSPNDMQDWGQFICQAQLSYEADGNTFILKASDDAGRLVGLYVLAPRAVTPKLLPDGRRIFEVQTGGHTELYASTAVVHIQGLTPPGQLRGLSPIACARQAIAVGMAAERFGAQWFGTGATLSGVITVPGQLRPEEAKQLAEQFQRRHGGVTKSHAVGVLSGGAAWTPISVSPEDSQFLETRRYTDVQIATLYGVPPEYVTEAEGAKGYVTGLYARQYMWLQTGLNPRLV
ncbi:MAG: phage portal protein, partial [Armatimonadia bacterium]